jgi:hypothetical protein
MMYTGRWVQPLPGPEWGSDCKTVVFGLCEQREARIKSVENARHDAVRARHRSFLQLSLPFRH